MRYDRRQTDGGRVRDAQCISTTTQVPTCSLKLARAESYIPTDLFMAQHILAIVTSIGNLGEQ